VKTINLKDSAASSLDAYKRRTDKLGHFTHIDKRKDLSDLPWETYGDDEDDKGIKKSILYQLARNFQRDHHQTIDLLHLFVSEKNWHDLNTLGWKIGSQVNGCQIALTKYRKNYDDTAIHEVLHAVWDYIRVQLGVNPETVIGVSEDGGVHGDAPGYTEYEYAKFIREIKSLYQEAVGEDLADEYRSTLQKTLRLAKKRYRQLKMQGNDRKHV